MKYYDMAYKSTLSTIIILEQMTFKEKWPQIEKKNNILNACLNTNDEAIIDWKRERTTQWYCHLNE